MSLPEVAVGRDLVRKAVVVVLALGITAVFLSMIAPFLMALLLAALFTGLSKPLFSYLVTRLGGRRQLASFLTLLATAIIVVIPLGVLATLLVAQALDISAEVSTWVKATVEEPGRVGELLSRLPFYETLAPYRSQVLQQAGDAVGSVSGVLVQGLSSVTLGTANFIFLLFVLLYSMYHLQLVGDKLMERILYYLPLKTRDEHVLLDKLFSVTRATIKGSLLVGLLQGTLAGIAFAVAGIPNAVFWGAVMTVLSVLPSVGSALVWIPATIVLGIQGEVFTAIGLGIFCALVVGTVDNLLRPVLVGKDTKMPELMIFLSTLGGIFTFGFPGMLLGPLIASLFISIWELYAMELKDHLPDVDLILIARGGELSTPEASAVPPREVANPSESAEKREEKTED